MASKAQIKLIKSLLLKKYRKKHGLFIAEGVKLVNEILHSKLKIHSIYISAAFIAEYNEITGLMDHEVLTEREMNEVSTMATPPGILALVEIPPVDAAGIASRGIHILLDGIRDPGNMGTIIRLADWYAVERIICSHDCVDAYNPKVVQATMGSICRVGVHYGDLPDFLKAHSHGSLYLADLEGTDIHRVEWHDPVYLVIGNESSGPGAGLNEFPHQKVRIPGYGSAESLNAAVATGIILDRIRTGTGDVSRQTD